MFPEEASWFYEKISEIGSGELFPMLNLGSSTGYFRTVMQPYIDDRLFKPLREQGRKVIHCDLKKAEGVDIAGDITSETFVKELKNIEFRSILCSHLLEHVENPTVIAGAIAGLVPAGGYLFVSCPYRYPHHPDPLDTMFRPSPDELAACFPGMKTVHSRIVSGGRYGKFGQSVKADIMELLRLSMPFYQPNRWLWHFRETKGSCLILKQK
jgi:hypothetical protein